MHFSRHQTLCMSEIHFIPPVKSHMNVESAGQNRLGIPLGLRLSDPFTCVVIESLSP